MNIVQAKCPHCQNTLRIPAAWLEKPMRCKNCKNTFQAKARSEAAAAPAAAAPVPAPAPAPVAPAPTPTPAAVAAPQAPAPGYYPPQPAAAPTTMPPPGWAPGMPPPGAPQYYQAPGMPPMMLPPGYAPPPGYVPVGYAPPGYAPPGYAPPGYAPAPSAYPQPYASYSAPAPPAANFGFDESHHDVHLDESPAGVPANGSPSEADLNIAVRRAPRANKKKHVTGLIIVAALLFVTVGTLMALLPYIREGFEKQPSDEPGPSHVAKGNTKDRDERPKLIIRDVVKDGDRKKPIETPKKDKDHTGPKTITNPKTNPTPVAFGGLPRRALFIAPENYLMLNSTHWYQTREGSGAGENAMTYRFSQGAPFNIEKNQVFVLTDQPDTKGTTAAPQREIIEAAIKDFCDTSRPQDRIILFFSGHACDIDGKGYLIPLEGDKDNKESLVPIEWVYEQLGKCKARQKIFVVDAFRYPPARGLELPNTGPMTEAVDTQLATPPDGVQVVTACVKDQQSLEFERGSLFQTCMLEAIRGMALGAIVQAKDSLPIADLIGKTNAIMQTKLEGVMADKKDTMTQTCRIAGKEPESGAEPNASDPAPKAVVFKSLENPSNTQLVKSIVEEIKSFPPMKRGQLAQLAGISVASLPGGGKDLEDYKDEGFNPFNDAAAFNAMKDKFPIRAKVFEISTKLKDYINLDMREAITNPGGPLDAKFKKKFLEEQKSPALATLDLEETLEDAKKLAEKREDEPSKRWQAHYDLSMARLQSRLVYIYEYNNLLALVRSDSMPELDPKIHSGWRINTSAKIQIKEAAVKAMAKDVTKTWIRMAKEYPNTPWAVIARREGNVSMGLQWVATRE